MRRLLSPWLLTMLLTSPVLAQELFVAQKARNVPSSSVAVLENEVAIDFSLLRRDSPKIVLSLPDGDRHEAILTDFEQRADGGTTWQGSIRWPGLERLASVILTVHDYLLVGTVSTPEGIYEIRPQPDRSHFLSKVDRSQQLDCGGATLPGLATGGPRATSEPDDMNEPEPGTSATGTPDKSTAIDVLAIYSSGARNVLGGHSQMRALIQHSIDYANSAFSNSSVSPRVVLRHSQEMAIGQNNWKNLEALRNHGAVRALRDEVGADLVAAFAHQLDVCGRGYLMDTLNTGFAPFAYSTNDVQCPISVAAHEIGHNLGLHHDPLNAGSIPVFAWAYGHFVDMRFRTVMSYAAECTNRNCPTIPYYSHPGLSYQGLPVGITNRRDNSRVLNVTGPIVATFRPSRSRPDAAFIYSPTRPLPEEPVSFIDRTAGLPDSWSWTFGDGISSNVRNPTHTYLEPGTYTVNLTAQRGGLGDTTSQQIVVEDVVASFEVAPQSPRVGLPLRFLDTSTGVPDSFQWSFGDGSSSTEASPTHIYDSLGTYLVELTATRNGRSHTNTTEIEIKERACTSSNSQLCLDQNRFEVEVEWLNFENEAGKGTIAPQGSDDSGIFWFFENDNLEMLVKVLDGCSLNDHFWVFAAATTNVSYTLRVTDTFTGEVREFTNPLGVSSPSITETSAFATCGVSGPAVSEPPAAASILAEPRASLSHAPIDSSLLPNKENCQANSNQLCLNGGRFKAEVDWRNFDNETGQGTTVFNLDDSGMFWFFEPDNWEMLIKVLDGCAATGHYWVFAAATTDVEYVLRVTDTETGDVQEYPNPLGIASRAITDTLAFASCPP